MTTFYNGDRVRILDPLGEYQEALGTLEGVITGHTTNRLDALREGAPVVDGYLVTLDEPALGVTLFIIPWFLVRLDEGTVAA